MCQTIIYLPPLMDQLTDTSKKKKKNLTNKQRIAIFQDLLKECENGKLKRGKLGTLATLFGVSTKTISRIWSRGKWFITNGFMADVSTRFVGRVGRKRVEIDFSKVLDIPKRRRRTLRSLAYAMNVPQSTLHIRVKEGALKRHTNAVKPHLTSANKIKRLNFCLANLHSQAPPANHLFQDMMNVVHRDEKWFFLSKEAERYYLLPEECEPYRTCKSKRFIPKIMFLAAVARPRIDQCRNEEFSGKIGIFPFIYKDRAKRNSKNRRAGTLETKPILSVTKEVYRACLIEKVIPAIRAKWPHCCAPTTIFIQQDNAKPHINPHDPQFLEIASRDGLNVKLCCQPPNSPDLNVLNLGDFRAIQSLQQQEAPSTVDELVEAVEKSFNEISYDSLNNIFLTLQQCMIEIIKDFGGNNYKVPHMGKNKLQRTEGLPIQLECDRDIVENASIHLLELEHLEDENEEEQE